MFAENIREYSTLRYVRTCAKACTLLVILSLAMLLITRLTADLASWEECKFLIGEGGRRLKKSNKL